MSIRDCILAKAAAGQVDPERAQAAADLFDDLIDANGPSASRPDAEAAAARQTIDQLEADAARRRRNNLKQSLIAANIQRHIADYRTASGEPNPGRAALAVLSRDLTDRTGIANVEARHQSVLGLIHSRIEALLSDFRPKLAGLKRDRGALKNVVRELFGEDTADATAAAAARAFSDGAEYSRQRFNAAGGAIPKRIDWGLPQSHDMLDVAAVSRDEWIDFIAPRLDRSQMVDLDTGAPMSDFRFFDVLTRAYDRISTGGLIDAPPQLRPRGRPAVANTRADSRVLIFRDADSWIDYQRRFGSPDLFETMTGHFDDMAMDIARLEVLGPNPDAMLHFMAQTVRRSAAGKGRQAGDRARSAVTALFRVDAELTGAAIVPVNSLFARGFQALRNMLTAAQLGAAVLSAMTDFAFQRVARGFNGLPAMRSAVPQVLRLMNPRDLGDQKLAVRMGFVAENWSSMAMAQKRFTGDVVGPRFSRLFSDFVLRASGLSAWTQAGRWAFGMEFLGHLGDLTGRRIAEMPTPTANALTRHGVTESDWLAVKNIPLVDHRGAEFLDIPLIAETAPDVANRLQQMIVTETEFAVPTSTVRTRAQLRQGTRPGTFAGEMLATVAQYKSFAVSIIHTHVMRGLNVDGFKNRGIYLANLIISTTIMGAVAWQAKQIQRGKDPQDMTTAKFWEAAMIQGGGLGIFGDFLFSDVNRFGQGPILTLAGPGAVFGQDLLRLTLGNVRQAIEGEPVNFGREAVRFAKRYTPGSSLWYSRLAMERLIFDELEKLADPDAHRRFRRIERRLRRERGQQFFWRPGAPRPDRPPNLFNRNRAGGSVRPPQLR